MKTKCKLLGLLIGALCASPLYAQTEVAENETLPKNSVIINSPWTCWYVQCGLDMSLQNPYGHDFSKVFPNGKTFGVDVAVGKWFTPELGLRAKVNWENGIRLFENGHADWLAPFAEEGTMYNRGVNMDRGGYLSLVGDIQLDVHNLFWDYDAERLWNLQAFIRAGGIYNFGVSKGSPLVGAGIGNTFRINERIKIYFDVAYQMVTSGFTGTGSTSTGTGSNSNGFFDINVGVQFNIGKTTTFKRP